LKKIHYLYIVLKNTKRAGQRSREIMKTEYRFFRKDGEDNRVLVVREKKFQAVNLCETYDRDGEQVGCSQAGCTNERHEAAEVLSYWDGHNHRSLVVSAHDGWVDDLEELGGAEAEALEARLMAAKEGGFEEAETGIYRAETDPAISYSIWQGSYADYDIDEGYERAAAERSAEAEREMEAAEEALRRYEQE